MKKYKGNMKLWKIPKGTILECTVCGTKVKKRGYNQKYCKPCSIDVNRYNVYKSVHRHTMKVLAEMESRIGSHTR